MYKKIVNMKQKITKTHEKNIIAKLALVLVTIALLFIGFLFIFNTLSSGVQKQKEQYGYSTQILLETHSLVTQFNNIQKYGNLFLVQKELHYLNIYQAEIDTFRQKLEHILQFIQRDDTSKFFTDIMQLFEKKFDMLIDIQLLFKDKKMVDSLFEKNTKKVENEIIKNLPRIAEASAITIQDTVWQKPKTFGQRLKEAFVPAKKRGKEIAAVHTFISTDSIIAQKTITENYILDSLYAVTKYYQHQYDTKIKRIEKELFEIITADQHITKEITDLLLQLHEESLVKVIDFGEKYDAGAMQALRIGFTAGVISIFIISVLVFLIIRNVRTIRKTHEILSLEKQKTEELTESRLQLLLTISHDIKTPLNALLGYLEMWEDESLSNKKLQELSTMQYSGKYILALLNNLLEFSRLEQHKVQITKENVEIVPFIMEIMEMFQPLCKEKNNKLTYSITATHNPQILTDSLKLKQILVNLISNAVKYTSKGKINVCIEEVCEENMQLKITVSDTGKGIPKKELDVLFEPFTRVEKNSAGIEGSGLGLFVVKGFIDLLKGKIDIKTEENKGTAVTFTIPFENVLENVTRTIRPKKSLKIWIIDDDATQLQVVDSMLQKLGHTVITCANKNEFEQMVGTYRDTPTPPDFDMVFTDLEMGELTGNDVLQKIKSRFDVPVVCLSGTSSKSKKEIKQMGFDDFLVKPFSLRQLEKLLSFLELKKQNTHSDLFSLDMLNELFNNDQKTISELLTTFATSLPDDIRKFEMATTEENLVLIQQTAHRILPFCKQINAGEVVPILEKIELSKKENEIVSNSEISLLILNLKRLLSEINARR